MAMNFNVRCRNHDYHSRCIYMITILEEEGLPPLMRLSGRYVNKKLEPVHYVQPLGKVVYDCIDSYFRLHPEVRVLTRAIMPDHIHLELFVTERTEWHLGQYIAAFTHSCKDALKGYLDAGTGPGGTSFWTNLRQSMSAQKRSAIFREGYNDRIAYRAGAKDAFYRYIKDNPYRYVIRKMHPEFFGNTLDLKIGDKWFQLYGNFLLLDNPVKEFVQISSKPEKRRDLPQRVATWREAIRQQGVLVSPFISKEERQYRNEAVIGGAGIIMVVNYEFRERYKPYKSLFELCEQGRLLLVSTAAHENQDAPMTREEALGMNEIAAHIAALQPGEARPLLRRRPRKPGDGTPEL